MSRSRLTYKGWKEVQYQWGIDHPRGTTVLRWLIDGVVLAAGFVRGWAPVAGPAGVGLWLDSGRVLLDDERNRGFEAYLASVRAAADALGIGEDAVTQTETWEDVHPATEDQPYGYADVYRSDYVFWTNPSTGRREWKQLAPTYYVGRRLLP